jgi:hypothetical protein
VVNNENVKNFYLQTYVFHNIIVARPYRNVRVSFADRFCRHPDGTLESELVLLHL